MTRPAVIVGAPAKPGGSQRVRKAREDEAEAWAKEMARAKPSPYVVGAPENDVDDDDDVREFTFTQRPRRTTVSTT